ncbi:hypothetical protein ScPMuIL_013731 [Solemya velum]
MGLVELNSLGVGDQEKTLSQEIRDLQRSTGNLIKRAPFQRLVKELVEETTKTFDFKHLHLLHYRKQQRRT